MAKGVILGAIWGAVVSALVLAAVSLTLPPPDGGGGEGALGAVSREDRPAPAPPPGAEADDGSPAEDGRDADPAPGARESPGDAAAANGDDSAVGPEAGVDTLPTLGQMPTVTSQTQAGEGADEPAIADAAPSLPGSGDAAEAESALPAAPEVGAGGADGAAPQVPGPDADEPDVAALETDGDGVAAPAESGPTISSGDAGPARDDAAPRAPGIAWQDAGPALLPHAPRPANPDASSAPDHVSDPAPGEEAPALPGDSGLPEAGGTPGAAPVPGLSDSTPAPAEAPPARPDEGGEADAPPDPGLDDAPPEGVRIGRLPTVEDIAPQEPGDGDDAGSGPQEGAPATPAPEDMPAVMRHAAAFEPSGARPRFAILLVDDGLAPQERVDLAQLDFPVTFVVDPAHPDAAGAATTYRAAGREVAILATQIPPGASPADLEVTFESHFGAVPEAVAVVEPLTGGFQADRLLAQQVVTILTGDGHGLVTHDAGLNAAAQAARSAGIANGEVYRVLDEDGENAQTIRRYLDRAAFRAAQQGEVIVMGHAREETLAGIRLWRREGRADTVALAPLSAVIAQP